MAVSQVEWDVATKTAGDYTCELIIRESQFNEFKSKHFDENGNKSIGQCFKQYLIENVEKAVIEEDKKIAESKGVAPTDPDLLKIAVVQFAFNNADLIRLLRLRVAAIKSLKFD